MVPTVPRGRFVSVALLALGLVSACAGPDFTGATEPVAGREAGADVDDTPIILPAPAPTPSGDDGGDSSVDGATHAALDATIDVDLDAAPAERVVADAAVDWIPADAIADVRPAVLADDGPTAEANGGQTGSSGSSKDAAGANAVVEASAAAGCPTGYESCAGGCAELSTDPKNCGACGNDCSHLPNVSAAGLACNAGRCAYHCEADYADCASTGSGCATSLQSPTNCGTCGVACESGEVCALSDAGGPACTLVCPSATTNCSGKCADLTSDSKNCGTCGTSCPAGTRCSGGGCVCDSMSGCEGCCSSATTCETYGSESNSSCGTGGGACGGCTSNVANAMDSCTNGQCGFACATDFTSCAGGCWDTATDPAHCGPSCSACGACAAGQCIDTKSVAAGAYNTCAMLSNGKVVCWGANDVGELGTGTTGSDVTSPSPGATAMLSGTAVAIAAGRGFGCALLSGGSVSCWGFNGAGMLGDQSALNEATPVAVFGLTNKVSAVAAGHGDACALYVGGGMACWGDNYYGEIGDGTNTNDLSAVSVLGVTGVSAMAPGVGDTNFVEHTCALLANNTVQCWGDNTYGELGDGTTTSRPTAAPVQGLSGTISAIAAGGYHTCVVLADGAVECWGGNTYGQLGNSSTTNSSTPVTVAGLAGPAMGIAAGEQHTCALLQNGTVQCWGFNFEGQLGTGVATTGSPFGITSPGSAGQVAGLSGVTQISAGAAHTCALVGANGPVMCWGYNSSGQLGNGTSVDAYAPVVVQW